MTEVWFYHLERQPLDSVLPRILSGLLLRGERVCVQLATAARLEEFSRVVWGLEETAFVAHGIEGDETSSLQRLWLTTAADNPIAAAIRVFADGNMPDDIAGLKRAMVFLDSGQESALAAARALWKRFKSEGVPVRYWKQSEQGRWEDRAAKAA